MLIRIHRECKFPSASLSEVSVTWTLRHNTAQPEGLALRVHGHPSQCGPAPSVEGSSEQSFVWSVVLSLVRAMGEHNFKHLVALFKEIHNEKQPLLVLLVPIMWVQPPEPSAVSAASSGFPSSGHS